MLSRVDFIFTIGYDGDTAIVDSRTKAKFGRLSTLELARAGLYKQAVCSAIYDEDEEALEKIMSIFNKDAEITVPSVERLKRILGVNSYSKNITRIRNY